jgi:hypothetical protein
MAAQDPVYACGDLGGKENAKHEAELLLILQMPFRGFHGGGRLIASRSREEIVGGEAALLDRRMPAGTGV